MQVSVSERVITSPIPTHSSRGKYTQSRSRSGSLHGSLGPSLDAFSEKSLKDRVTKYFDIPPMVQGTSEQQTQSQICATFVFVPCVHGYPGKSYFCCSAKVSQQTPTGSNYAVLHQAVDGFGMAPGLEYCV